MSPASTHAARAAQLAAWRRIWTLLLSDELPADERQQAAPDPPHAQSETASVAAPTASETRRR